MAAVGGAGGGASSESPSGVVKKDSYKPDANPYKLSDDVMKQLNELRAAVGDDIAPEGTYWGSNEALKRFLDARKGDIPAAKEQYANAMRWRREHEIDSILEWWKEPEVMRR